ncbi:MAG: AI-2E family transporter [Acidimicrobiales bacterium]|nr:AI-2E family transporter [Acidimicrobiales bacterium]MCB9392052.1 AI-2E family transporter [Acidimicrobiaceae bacterium]
MPPDPDEPVPPATRPAQATVPVSDPRATPLADRLVDDAADAELGVERMPRWVWRAVAVFWIGFLVALAAQRVFSDLANLLVILLVSLFLSLAVEPGVNRLSQRGWRRGSATGLILVGVVTILLVFVVAIGTLVAGQIADLLRNSETYVTDTVDWLNDTFDTNIDPADVIAEIQDEDGRIQQFIADQGDEAVRVSLSALGVLFQALTVMLFTFYLVADGPRLRRVICSRLRPSRQRRVLEAWDLAIDKTGGYLYSRALLAGLSAVFHWIVFQAVGTQAPLALAVWVGLISQFLPVVGTYLAGVLPVLVTLLDSPVKALIIAIAIVLYQQVENYVFAPRITARTMELHPALAFGSAIAGAAVLGAVGAILALPAVAMFQALMSNMGPRFEVVDDRLTQLPARRLDRRAVSAHPDGRAGALGDDDR